MNPGNEGFAMSGEAAKPHGSGSHSGSHGACLPCMSGTIDGDFASSPFIHRPLPVNGGA
jgi:hypothetical protein